MMMKRYVLGLDISTTCVGCCVIDRDMELDDNGKGIIILDYTEFKKCNTFFEKADVVDRFFVALKSRVCEMCCDECVKFIVAVEEPLMGFQTGMSSAATITTLMRFNGITSYLARNTFKIDPQYISSSHARKLCGIKMQRTKVAGKCGKDQVFDYMCVNDLKYVKWPLKKNGTPKDIAKDMTDSYCIARAACIMNT